MKGVFMKVLFGFDLQSLLEIPVAFTPNEILLQICHKYTSFITNGCTIKEQRNRNIDGKVSVPQIGLVCRYVLVLD